MLPPYHPTMANNGTPTKRRHALDTVSLMSGFSVRTYSQYKSRCRPTGIFVTKKHDYVIADHTNKCVKVFNKLGQLKLEFGNEHLKKPWNVVVLANGNIVVSDPGAPDVKIFNHEGVYIKSFDYANNLQEPYGLALSRRGEVLVADKGANCIYVYSADGFLADCVRPSGGATVQWPQYIAVDARDNIVVSDYVGHAVVCVTRQGQRVFTYGGPQAGVGDGQLMCPEGVCIDSYGNILVADSANERVQLLSSDGRFQKVLVGSGHGLETPEAVCLDNEEYLLVTDGRSGEVKTYNYLS